MIKIEDTPSPNFNERKHPVDMLVLHYTGMETGEAALTRMCDPAAEVSAHYMVWEDGRIARLVAEDKRAWHAGVASWQGDSDLNSRSIGIEIVNGGHDFPLEDGALPPYPAAQIEAVIQLCRGVLTRHTVPQSRIVAHSDIAPARKPDPGEHFPWAQLAEAGIGIWPAMPDTGALNLIGRGLGPSDSGAPVRRLQETLASIGYEIEATGAYNNATEAVITAFQRRWVQDRVTGNADMLTLSRIEAVAELSHRL